MDKYDVQCRVGQGAYGTVLRARHRETGQIVAIKKMAHSKNPLGVLREICALRNLSHKHILKFIDISSSADTVSIITELVRFHLNDIILDGKRPRDDPFIQYFYKQILLAVDYMHSLFIMHRDLKPENILVTTSLCVKVADFGQACLYYPDEPKREYEENVATRWYRAPELLFGCRQYGPSVDIWSMGCVLAEMVTGAPILQGRSDIEQMSKVFGLLGTPREQTWPSWEEMPDAGKLIFDEKRPLVDWSTLIPGGSQDVIRFIKQHLKLDALQRSTAKDLLEQNYMKASRNIWRNSQFRAHFPGRSTDPSKEHHPVLESNSSDDYRERMTRPLVIRQSTKTSLDAKQHTLKESHTGSLFNVFFALGVGLPFG